MYIIKIILFYLIKIIVVINENKTNRIDATRPTVMRLLSVMQIMYAYYCTNLTSII